ncbi:MAG: PilZ domain-containing protein [Candidatus Omnitrophica bacterium]|nr:PilZ domain-containing protein [Candidatus Omnitrophota bacterium]MDD5351670.1 PilZ domain-containing protein [Candidatus Omnitrophota bacterium]MDD5550880.1 PilZ domain-containing protein [Candidatus Omnitrophota bacterium]
MLIKKIPQDERRKYRRLDTVFPVEFQILDKELNPVSGWQQAFSQDISKGGICLTINNLNKDKPLKLVSRETNLLLQIHSPISERHFLAYTKVMWAKKIQESPFEQYIAGVSFSNVDSREISRLLSYVRFKKILWHTLQLLILGLLCYSAFAVVNNLRLNSRNNLLINQYSQLIHKNLELNENYKMLLDEREKLDNALENSEQKIVVLEETLSKTENSKNEQIQALENELIKANSVIKKSEQDLMRIKELEKKINELKNAKEEDIAKLKSEIFSLREEGNNLKEKLSQAVAKESKIQAETSAVVEEETVLAEGFQDKLYNWLSTHQISKTGLIVSFEGDYNLKDTTFIYDQALAVITYTLFGDYEKAKRGLDFFLNKAEKIDGEGFYNAYYSKKGDVAEYIAHAGPNLWLGIAIAQYTNRTKDYTYINLAKQIAHWINSLQDREGGITGGRGLTWYSTEHNLDGFAFFSMLYQLTKDEGYRDTAGKILNWLEKYAYGNESIPVNRGKGDSTIATDTYAWSIAALGPAILKELNMDPDGILEFAVENCAVEAEFKDRSGKNIAVSGFDFSKPQNIARGGVVSCEWTAQIVLSFKIMSDYYLRLGQANKSAYYKNQALRYLNELNKMAISSFSSFGRGDWCLPYASHENVDTGHSWRTPKGNRTGSVAATAYTIFAISGFNPLRLYSNE